MSNSPGPHRRSHMSLITDFRFALRSLARVKGLADHRRRHAGARHRRQRRDLQRRPRRAAAAARQPRRGSADLHPPERAGHRRRERRTSRSPRCSDLRARVKTLTAFGDFSTIEFTMVGLGEPRVVRAGVVGGSYFDVMGLRPVLGRLLGPADDGPKAAGAAVLTHRFWTTALKSDPSVHRQDGPARRSLGDDRRRARAVGAVSDGDRDHRQRRDEPASSRRDDGGRAACTG